MTRRNLAIGFTTLAILFSGGVQAQGFFDLVKHALPHEKQEYRSGTISQDQALDLYSAQQKLPSFEACADQFPASKPINVASVPPKMKAMALCSDHFAVLYSQTTRTPLIVAERLSAAQLRDAKGEQRTNAFYPDPRIPMEGRAELIDYSKQFPSVDRGHQSPAGDQPTPKAMAQSFALSNMVPQDPDNNRKAWNKVESDVRKFVQRAGGDVFVFTGPLFDKGFETVGVHKVWKPTRLYKLVYDASSQRAWGYVLENKPVNVEKPMDYATFVQTTGLHLLDHMNVAGTAGRG
ncbi:DNA/RNA non-specific endonuclease [Pseudomonas sp. MWU12-2323]|uniref:DNA/RNA non-specific endonuclease n=1 Tax=Pseudomonas sp. MWU12-2323 TaxID=2651296 RepID=UPI00128D3BC1|nr:DNA/RNA non-specific endonuclease [Pseudomonas sp. MWU12-2323]MPQ71464.1 DNA/RNA non-specific endonuclease [Pseudomonas sp. MWU12-2323]